jgi:tetraacyldisaccharide 4'-kinase
VKQSPLIWLLLPLSKIYGLITDVRNCLFDNGLLSEYRPAVFTVSVGNLTVGGTGKTPMVEYLIKRFLMSAETTPSGTATLSRGYGRKTNGFRVASPADTADTLGDEPLQLYRKFGQQVRVCVGEKRADAIQALLMQYPETNRVLLDDAFQHRAVRPHLNLLLMDYNRPIYTDHPFPAGRLRERRRGARRADALIVTKCPAGLNLIEQQRIKENLSRYTRPDTPVFFAGLQYDQPMSFATHQSIDGLRDVVLVSGLANADPLEQYVRQAFSMQRHHRFADHYAYTRADLDQLLRDLQPGESLLTTEKDWVKLDALLTPAERETLPLFCLPVQVVFLGDDDRTFGRFLDELPNYPQTFKFP